MDKVLFERDLTIDSKRRATLSGAEYDHYHMKRYDDGTIVLEPRVLVHPDAISEDLLQMMDDSMENFRKGVVSEPVELTDELRAFAGEQDEE